MKIPGDSKQASLLDTEGGAPPADAPRGSFIVNLCSLPGPLVVPQPCAPELGAVRFFVSRCRKGGRDFFYLHMGFFDTQEESEKWAGKLRHTYPNAFVSQLSDKTRSRPEPEGPDLSDTQTVRVLQVRAPTRDSERSDATVETGYYAVQSEAGVAAAPPAASPVIPSMSAARAKPTSSAETPAKHGAGQKSARGLTESLNALANHEFEMAPDTASTTGVRHLRVEIVRKRKRTVTSWNTRKF
jgi:hypothetical protein